VSSPVPSTDDGHRKCPEAGICLDPEPISDDSVIELDPTDVENIQNVEGDTNDTLDEAQELFPNEVDYYYDAEHDSFDEEDSDEEEGGYTPFPWPSSSDESDKDDESEDGEIEVHVVPDSPDSAKIFLGEEEYDMEYDTDDDNSVHVCDLNGCDCSDWDSDKLTCRSS
jgi:hypothetical protein